jgi:acid phosphatase type 7
VAFRLRVAVTATNGAGATTARSAATAGIVAAPSPQPPPPGGPDPVLAAAGDIACNSAPTTTGSTCHYGLTASAVTSDASITDVVTLGDNQYECSDYANVLRFYDPTWGVFRAKTHPAVGNHEYNTAPASGCDAGTTTAAKGYFDYWNGVDVGTGPAGDRTKGYYSYDLGSWHLVALNSNCARVGGCDAGSPQETWLRNDLAAHPAACTLAYWHHPRFSSGEHGDNPSVAALWEALYAAGADVVLNGHDHDYERFAAQTPAGAPDPASGIREFVVGTGGKSHYAFRALRPNSEVHNGDTYGILKLTLHPQGYDWQFVPESGGTFTDSGSGSCHAPPAAPAP